MTPGFVFQSEAYKYYPYREDPAQPAYAQSLGAFWSVSSSRVRERPLRYLLWYVAEKPYYLWSWNILQSQGDVYVYPVSYSLYQRSAVANATRVFMKGLHPLLVLLALAGIVGLIRQLTRRDARVTLGPVMLVATVLYFTALYTVFVPWPRYAVPLRPVLYLLAVWAGHALLQFVFSRSGTSDSIPPVAGRPPSASPGSG